MSFVSPEFAFALLLFLPVFWSLRGHQTARLWVLTVASYLLYASCSPVAALVLFAYSLFVWQTANRVNAAPPSQRGRRLRVALSLLLALGVLLVTKYYEFVRQMLAELLPGAGMVTALPVLDLVAPAGISFFTFQAITLLVWRYRAERVEPLPLAKVLAFLAFWPTLFAGPILRAEDFFKQIEGEDFGRPQEVPRALYLILLGLAQKLVFASWLAERFVDHAFAYPDTLDAFAAGAAIWGYTLQIFLDFSGYSLIVTGLALLLGYRVPLNFRQPYLAGNLREFWRGWHITLSSFIRDYIYIPLGGSRAGFARAQANLLLAMLVSGLWHGANTTFVLWGALHGAGVVLLNLADRVWPGRLPKALGVTLTLACVALAWVFFRAVSVAEAAQILHGLSVAPTSFGLHHLGLALFSVLFFRWSARAAQIEARACEFIEAWRGWRLAAAGSMLGFLVIYCGPNGIPAFIYYRF